MTLCRILTIRRAAPLGAARRMFPARTRDAGRPPAAGGSGGWRSKSSVFMIFMIRNWRRSTVSMANNTTDATAPTAAKMKPPVMNFHSVRKMNTTSAIEQSVIRNFRPFITVG